MSVLKLYVHNKMYSTLSMLQKLENEFNFMTVCC